jgi:hypothetical protein
MSILRFAPIACCALLLASCGGGDPQRADSTRTQATQPPDAERNPLELPAGVPLKATGPADPAQAKVIRAWSDALRAGDVAAASAVWGVPSKVQNGTPVLKLPNRSAVRLFNGSLPCGSVVTAAGGAPHGFTIAKVRLTQRKGARCDAQPGATARTAIRVRDGRIVEWYRLPDDPDAPGLQPKPQDDPQAQEI